MDRNSLVFADVDLTISLLKQLRIDAPKSNSYPDSLKEFYYREIWESTLGTVENDFREGRILNQIFIKPAEREKSFTGLVLDSQQSFYFVGNTSRRQKVHCSEVVRWLSEYRIYVVNSEIRSIDFYAGDSQIKVNENEIKRAIKILDGAKESYAGYAIDFGVLSTGETALVEMNDGFSIGAYKNVCAKDYTDMIFARWAELLEKL